MARPRAADDFAAIRARMEELQRERGQVASNRTEMDTSEPGRSVSAPISVESAPSARTLALTFAG